MKILRQKFSYCLLLNLNKRFFFIGNINKAIEDCTTALDLLKPEVSLNLKERALCIGRRGEALCRIGFIKQGVEEIKISLKLMSSDYFTNILETVEKKSE